MIRALCLSLTLTLTGCGTGASALPIALKALAGVAALAEEMSRPRCEDAPHAPSSSPDGGAAADAAEAGHGG